MHQKFICSSSIAILGMLCLAGCKTVIVQSEADLFLMKHPALRTNYIRLDPTSIYMMQRAAYGREVAKEHYLKGFRELAGTNITILDELKEMQIRMEAGYKEELKPIDELERALARYGGQIYSYEFLDGKFIEEGYALISGGEIRIKAGVIVGRREF